MSAPTKGGRPKGRPAVKPPSGTASTDSMLRINKALASAGVCSRRAADELIATGKVLVNGAPAEPGLKIDPAKDKVEVNGKRVEIPIPGKARHLYLVMNKPVRVVTTADDPEGRDTVLDLLPEKYAGARVFPVGRLDFFSEGLILLTDDGELAHRMTHPRWHLEKVYELTVRGKVPVEALEAMRAGMVLAEGEKLAPVKVSAALPSEPGRTRLALILIQGVNRQIRRMCRDLGLTILKLVRVRQGPLELGQLAPGKIRELSPDDVAALKKALKLG